MDPPDRRHWWNENTVAVVTGGNKGIGLEVVRQLAQHGLTVVLTARDRSRGLAACSSLVEEGLQSVIFHELDVGSPDSVAKFAAWLKETYGGLDILVNNAAAIGFSVDFEAMEANDLKLEELVTNVSTRKKYSSNDVESGKTCININYYGVKRTIEALLPLFRPSPAGARIVNVSSDMGQLQNLPNEFIRQKLTDHETLTEDFIEGVLGTYLEDLKEGHLEDRGWPEDVASYKMSKIGLNAYTRVLARNLKSRPEGQKIYANVVHPGWVKTDISFQTGDLTPSEAADGVVWLALIPPGGPSGEFFAYKNPFQF